MREAYAAHDHFYVLDDRIALPADMEGKTYFVHHAQRSVRTLINLVEALRILRDERPDVILSTGAGVVVPFALAGKALGIPTVFVETMTRVVRPSLTGRIMYVLADRFFYQWEGLRRVFPKGTFGGRVF